MLDGPAAARILIEIKRSPAHAIDPSVAEISRLNVKVMFGDGGQRGVMEVDRMGFVGGEPNVDIVTHYPSDHFFELLFDAYRT